MEVQLWDNDVMTPNDYLCSFKFDASCIYQMIRTCMVNDKSAKYRHRDQKRDDGKFEVVTRKNPNKQDCSPAKLLMSMEILTEAE